MKARKPLLTVALTAALGLGVWTLALSFTSASFGDGDILSAAELNSLLNGNFDAVDAEFTALDNAKFDKAGGDISGRTSISGAANSSGLGDASTVFHANNTSSTGSAGVFQSNNDSNNGALSVKQLGTGPALTLKSNGGGPLISGAMPGSVTIIVEQDGSIKIGDMGAGTDSPTLHLNAADGTITNSVGSGLPVAFGSVRADGTKASGTSNWTVSVAPSGTVYYINIDGESYHMDRYVTVATPRGSAARSITANAASTGGHGVIALGPVNASGIGVSDGFFFVVYKPGS